ncbi:MAG: 3-methyladenine DNA glycosylase 2 [Rhodocyclaceae bacterium]
MSDIVAARIPLPKHYRVQDVLAFHRRDVQAVAERVDEAHLEKGLLWSGQPACLSIRFVSDEAQVLLDVDGRTHGADAGRLESLVRHMLGLNQPVETFEQRHGKHPVLGPLIKRQRGLRVPLTPDPFEALTWAITGQQISVSAAVSLRRRLIEACGATHSSGLRCYPDAARVAGLSADTLRTAGFSTAKTHTLQTLAGLAASGELPLDAWAVALPVDEITNALRSIRGIGPWTVSYALLRGFGFLDGSLHGDVAVRNSLQRLLGEPERIGETQAREWLEPFAPWRALTAAHLWAALSLASY